MKYITLILLIVSAAVQAQTGKVAVHWYEDFPVDMVADLGAFECTGGGVPVDLFTCVVGDEPGGIHIRGMEGYTCLMDENMEIVATTWFSINANWDASFTGPVHGEWKVIMGSECNKGVALADHDSYFAGTYTGKRKFVSSPGDIMPYYWYGKWKLDGYGIGDFDGIQFKSVNEYVTYSPIMFQYEIFDPDNVIGIRDDPEGEISGLMIFDDD